MTTNRSAISALVLRRRTRSATVGAFVPLQEFWATIFHLLRPSRPAQVAWFVSSVIVDAVNRVMWRRLWSEFIAERLERIAKHFGHLYAATTVIGKSTALWVRAAMNRSTPNHVKRITGVSVLVVQLGAYFVTQASAAIRKPAAQCVTANIRLIPALAFASPNTVQLSRQVWRSGDNSPSAKFCSNKIGCFRLMVHR